MNPTIDYAGVTYELEVGTANLSGFTPVQGVDNLDFDTTNESITRPFVNGKKLEIQTEYGVALTGRLTDLGDVNADKLLGDYMYAANAAIDSDPNITVSADGALKLGLARTIAVPGSVRLRPVVAAQSNHTLYFLGAKVSLGEPSLEDNLLSTGFRITADEVVKGELTYVPPAP